MQDAGIGQRGFDPHAQEDAGGSDHIELAVPDDAIQISLLIIYRSDHAAVQVGFGGEGTPRIWANSRREV